MTWKHKEEEGMEMSKSAMAPGKHSLLVIVFMVMVMFPSCPPGSASMTNVSDLSRETINNCWMILCVSRSQDVRDSLL